MKKLLTMKTLFILASMLVVLFLAAPTKIEAQKRKTTKKTSRKGDLSNNNDLSRSKAAELISKDAAFGDPPTWEFEADFTPGYPYKAQLATSPLHKVLQSLGYMDSDFKLTEKGKTSIAGLTFVRVDEYQSDYWKIYYKWNVYSMPALRKKELVEVTGISEENPVGAVKKAEFTWRWKPVNDIGRAYTEQVTYYGSYAVFKKFDDGWRVDRMTLYMWRTKNP